VVRASRPFTRIDRNGKGWHGRLARLAMRG
jgi:hypothetical protein